MKKADIRISSRTFKSQLHKFTAQNFINPLEPRRFPQRRCSCSLNWSAPRSGGGLLGKIRIAKNCLQLQKFLKPSFAPLSPVARLLVAAEACAKVDTRPVDVHVASANPLGYST